MIRFIKNGWDSFKEYTAKLSDKAAAKLLGVSAIVTGTAVSTSANAALDPAVATTFTSIQSDFTAMMGLVWPVIGVVFASLAIIGLVRAALHRGGVRA